MKLVIDRPHAEALMEHFPALSALGQQLRFGSRVEVPLEHLDDEQLAFLHGRYLADGPEMALRAAQLGTIRQALAAGGERYAEHELERLLPAVVQYLLQGALRGWLFKLNAAGKPLAYLVSRIDFTPPGEEETGRILIDLKANAMARIVSLTLQILDRDIRGRTLPEILLAKGFLKESEALVQAYEHSTQRFFAWRSDYGRQFSGAGTAIYAEDPLASHRHSDWARKEQVVLSSTGGRARLVNDEAIIQDRALVLDAPGDVLGKYLRKAGRSMKYDEKVEKAAEALQADIPEGLFAELPVHAYVLMFHLELHHHVWVHVDDMQPYEYQPTLKDKLILPPEQTDLIDILTAEMDVLMDDIVEGKSGGTTVLCAGPPGVGKTLTAEVYSEIIRRPLYRVHSGQLGLSVAEMETTLKATLTRAQRWGAVMLIDEADVYIKRRDDNIQANAVVGVFLRVLEYFNGLLFLTTNRVDDIDEAVVSRCIALIRYHPPGRDDRWRIWRVMTEQFGLEVSEPLAWELASRFPDASGRDIKGLAKLVAKYCTHKGVGPSLAVFERCSVFRGMDTVEAGPRATS